MRLRVFSIVSLIMATSACGRRAIPKAALKIVEGSSVAAGSSLSLATVALATPATQADCHSFCSGTLIAPTVVLTAAHCVVDDDFAPIAAESVVIHGIQVNDSAATYAVRSIFRHRDYTPTALADADAEPMHDLALVQLREAPADALTVAISSAAPSIGETLVVAGYGVTRYRSIDNTGRLRQAPVQVASVRVPGQIFWAYGDSRETPDGPVAEGACAGDSGGPVYRKEGRSGLRLVGVTSFGEEAPSESYSRSYCVGANGYVDLSHYADAINAAVQRLETAKKPSATLWLRAD